MHRPASPYPGTTVTTAAPAPGPVLLRRRAALGLLAGGLALGGVGGAFELVEDLLEAHDRRGQDLAPAAQSGIQQGMGEKLLLGSHLPHCDPLALARNEVPVFALLVGELELRQRLLVR